MRHRALRWSVGGLAGLLVVIGATTFDITGAYEGRELRQTFDVGSFQSASVVMGAQEFAHLGGNDTSDFTTHARPIAVADWNGDGIQDVAAGAPNSNGRDDASERTGAVYVVFGKRNLPAVTDGAGMNGADLTLIGAGADAEFGFALAAGDLNGDGLDDLAIGAPGADSVFVLFGSQSLRTGTTVDFAAPEVAHVALRGNNKGERFGHSLASVRPSRKGQPSLEQENAWDLLIGAPASASAFLIRDGFGQPGTVNLNDLVHTSFRGDANSGLGTSVALGDISGDGNADVVLGAPYSTKRSGTGESVSETGAVFAVFDRLAILAAAAQSTVDIAVGTHDLAIFGRSAADHLGSVIAIGDVTGDGTADLLLGAPDADVTDRIDAGAVFALAGGNDLADTIDLGADSTAAVIYGARAGDRFGAAVTAGRHDTDQISDLIVGAPGAGDGKGMVSIVYGSSRLRLHSVRDAALEEENVRLWGGEGESFGWSLSVADLGRRYLVIGAPRADGAAGSQSGKVYLIPQAANMPPTTKLNTPNGGEQVQIGNAFNISWTADDPDGTNTLSSVELRLSTDGGATFPIPIASGLPGTATSFNWQVNVPFASFSAKVRVIVTDNQSATAQDESDGTFTLVDNGVPVTLLSPNGGERISQGSTVINWSVPAQSRIRLAGFDLFFSTDDGATFSETIARGLGPQTSSFSWNIPQICANRVRILVIATTLPGARTSDASDASLSVFTPGPSIDPNRMFLDDLTERMRLTTAPGLDGFENLFLTGCLVEISASEEPDAEFVTFEKPTTIKRGGRKLLTRGLIDGKDLSEFFPLGATRIIRVTNPACGVTQFTVRRFGFQFFVQQ